MDILGGRVIIVLGDMKSERNFAPDGFHTRFWEKLEKSKQHPIDTLSIIPHHWVEKAKDRKAILAKLYEDHGKKVWDGSVARNREVGPENIDEFRIVQYDSCRGLEGWMVVNYCFDELYDEKLKYPQLSQSSQADIFADELKMEQALQYAKKWLMIPMTRAMDTVFLHISKPDSFVGKCLIELNKEFSDQFQLWDFREKESTKIPQNTGLTEKPPTNQRFASLDNWKNKKTILVTVQNITHNTGIKIPHEWKELDVIDKNKKEIQKVRHKTSNFDVKIGDEIWITGNQGLKHAYFI